MGIQRPGIFHKVEDELRKSEPAECAIKAAREGRTPVVVLFKDTVSVIADSAVAGLFSKSQEWGPTLVVPIRDEVVHRLPELDQRLAEAKRQAALDSSKDADAPSEPGSTEDPAGPGVQNS